MANAEPPGRIVGGQSLNDTANSADADSAGMTMRVIMVSMMLTMLAVLAVIGGSVRADDTVPHNAAVAVARAEIISGLRVGPPLQPADPKREARETPLPKPRERPCPEREGTPCRLMIVDMP
jgi:hypothetical protein